MSLEHLFDLLSEPDDQLHRYVQRAVSKARLGPTDIALVHRDGTCLVLRVSRLLPPKSVVNGEEVDGDRIVWRFAGDEQLYCRTFEARFQVLCSLLEMVPDAVVVTMPVWGQDG